MAGLATTLVAALLLGTADGAPGTSHPIHSSTLILRDGPARGQLAVELRAFIDDFPPGDTGEAIEKYLADKVTILDRKKRRIELRYRSHMIDGAVLKVQLMADAPFGVSGGSVRNRLVQEKFADQVNVVEIATGGRHALLVFLASDGEKPIE